MAETLLSKRLKELRKMHNFTQDYVASALGIIRQTYSHYETGKRIPSTETLYKLSAIYDISFEDLIQLSITVNENEIFELPAKSSSSEELSAILEYFNNPNNRKKYQHNTNIEKELLYYFQQISDEDKKEIIEIIKIKIKLKQNKSQTPCANSKFL